MTNEELCAKVYEAITGKRWHKKNGYCCTCGARFASKHTAINHNCNPPLLTSLDAWAEYIWPMMSDEQKEKFALEIALVLANDETVRNFFEATPLHHLEACARMLNLWGNEKDGIHSIHCPAYLSPAMEKDGMVPGKCNCKRKDKK